MDHDNVDMLRAERQAFAAVDRLVAVDESFRETVRFILHRTASNPLVRLFCFQVSQLSQLGTGFDSSFEKGNAQSDRLDDVVLNFTTASGGVLLVMRLRGDRITLRHRGLERTVALPRVGETDRQAQVAVLDEMIEQWWES